MTKKTIIRRPAKPSLSPSHKSIMAKAKITSIYIFAFVAWLGGQRFSAVAASATEPSNATSHSHWQSAAKQATAPNPTCTATTARCQPENQN